jgi:hypothetical protein
MNTIRDPRLRNLFPQRPLVAALLDSTSLPAPAPAPAATKNEPAAPTSASQEPA